jgi:hypothetical protein
MYMMYIYVPIYICVYVHIYVNIHIQANEKGSFPDPIVRETALLALCRYMSVSNGLCELYLPLLFTAVEKETNASTRTTVIIALVNYYSFMYEDMYHIYECAFIFMHIRICI